MDIGSMSMVMRQASVQSAVSVSVMKIAMNSQENTASQMTDMINNIAVDTSSGTNIDVRV